MFGRMSASFLFNTEICGAKANLNAIALVVTLTGAGGTGKTRLSLDVAASLSEHFADGVVYVALAALSDPNLVASTIAKSLSITERLFLPNAPKR